MIDYQSIITKTHLSSLFFSYFIEPSRQEAGYGNTKPKVTFLLSLTNKSWTMKSNNFKKAVSFFALASVFSMAGCQ
ncbi:hypothetical protein, partial [Rufibacter immobilis]|uniref:hypothetical protein n=1 Tax=Rufibacter immobilis TaxID=1348778 RepID=UPI0035E6D4DD